MRRARESTSDKEEETKLPRVECSPDWLNDGMIADTRTWLRTFLTVVDRARVARTCRLLNGEETWDDIRALFRVLMRRDVHCDLWNVRRVLGCSPIVRWPELDNAVIEVSNRTIQLTWAVRGPSHTDRVVLTLAHSAGQGDATIIYHMIVHGSQILSSARVIVPGVGMDAIGLWSNLDIVRTAIGVVIELCRDK
jgi:hypothetical protein